MSKVLWLKRAQHACELHEHYPREGWEKRMYFYLFQWAGYRE